MTIKEFNRIRWLSMAFGLVFGVVELLLNWMVFDGAVALLSLAFVGLSVTTSLCCVSWSKSEDRRLASATLKGDVALLVLSAAVGSAWLVLASNVQAAGAVQAEWKERLGEFKEAQREAQAGYEKALDAYNKCAGRDLSTYTQRSAILQQCGGMPNKSDFPASVPSPGQPPQESAKIVAFRWAGWLKVVNVLAMAICVFLLGRLSWLAAAAKIEGLVGNLGGKEEAGGRKAGEEKRRKIGRKLPPFQPVEEEGAIAGGEGKLEGSWKEVGGKAEVPTSRSVGGKSGGKKAAAGGKSGRKLGGSLVAFPRTVTLLKEGEPELALKPVKGGRNALLGRRYVGFLTEREWETVKDQGYEAVLEVIEKKAAKRRGREAG